MVTNSNIVLKIVRQRIIICHLISLIFTQFYYILTEKFAHNWRFIYIYNNLLEFKELYYIDQKGCLDFLQS